MGDWIGYVFGSICGLIAVLQFLMGVYFMIEINRKWRNVPEFWSIDWVDIVLRLKHTFGVVLTGSDFEEMSAKARYGLTAGQLWEQVQLKLQADGREVPVDGWEKVVAQLAEALNVKPERITPDSTLYGDLDMRYMMGD